MKKSAMLLGLLVVLNILAGCMPQESKNPPIEMIAFDSLTKEEADLIPASPKDSKVEKIPVTSSIKKLIQTDYDKSEVYAVIFNHTDTNSSGLLTVFIDSDRTSAVGKGYTFANDLTGGYK